MLGERGRRRCSWVGCSVVAGHAGDGRGELGDPVVPGAEPGAEHAQGILRAAEGVAAMVVGSVGVVVDGPEQAYRTQPGVPPRP